MQAAIHWLEQAFAAVPFSLLEVWGRLGYLVGLLLLVLAFGRFTFRPAGHWGLGRISQSWNERAQVNMTLTALLVIATGYIGSFIVLVPGAQTFESLKDVSVFLCIVLFGYPALVIVPVAYGISDLIEGVPPDFLWDWILGYFINPCCFWIAAQLIGKDPDFRKPRVWFKYLVFVAMFMAIEPILWGYICADKFTAEISFHSITPALFFTTSITWMIVPFAMLVAYPFARKTGLFWADIPGYVREKPLGKRQWAWESGAAGNVAREAPPDKGVSLWLFMVPSFVVLTMAIVSLTAYVGFRSAENIGADLARRLHEEVSENINLQFDEFLEKAKAKGQQDCRSCMDEMLRKLPVAAKGLAIVIDQNGRQVATSVKEGTLSAFEQKQGPDVPNANAAAIAVEAFKNKVPQLAAMSKPVEFSFHVVTAKPLGRETWLAMGIPYSDREEKSRWIILTAIPESNYLGALRSGNSHSAMIYAVTLLLSLAIATLLATIVVQPLRRISKATQELGSGNWSLSLEKSHLAELNVLSESFNSMSAQLKAAFNSIKANEAIVESSEDAIIAADLKGVVYIWNKGAEILFGYTSEEICGHTAERVIPQERMGERATFYDSIMSGGSIKHAETERLRKDGSRIFVSMTMSPIRDEQDRIVGASFIARDITERRRQEAAIIELNQLLETRVQERTKELQDSTHQLQATLDHLRHTQDQLIQSEKLAGLGAIVAAVAHELNTPIGNCVAVASTVALKNADLERQVQAGMLRKSDLATYLTESSSAMDLLRRGLSRASMLINNFKQVAVDQSSSQRREFTLDVAMEEMAQLIQSTLRKTPYMLHLEIEAGIVMDSYPGALEQVVNNLINNSVIHGFDGRDSGHMRLRAQAEGEMVRMIYTDDGAGMSESVMHRIFDPFFTTRMGKGGNGLGMSIAYNLVKGPLGGDIQVEAGKEGGVLFTILLPLTAPAPRKDARDSWTDAMKYS